MLAAALDHWDRMALAEYGQGEHSEMPGEFGFYGPFPDILEVCQMVVMSKYQCWPEPGGYFDQPEWFQHDFKTYMQGYAAKLREHRPQKPEANGDGASDELYDVPDFSELG